MILVGERKACAALVLAFYAVQFLTNGLLGPGELAPLLLGLGSVYAIGFMGLVSGWFWARWFCLGLGMSGSAMAGMMLWQVGPEPVAVFWGITHLLLAGTLFGEGPATMFDGRKDWRTRWQMDEGAVDRLGKSITRAGASLPYLIMAGLAPKQPGSALPLLALALGGLGVWGLIRMRTWGLFAMAGAAVLALVGPGPAMVAVGGGLFGTAPLHVFAVSNVGVVAGLLLVAAVIPFAAPLWRLLRR